MLDSTAHGEAKQDHNGAVCLMLLGEPDVASAVMFSPELKVTKHLKEWQVSVANHSQSDHPQMENLWEFYYFLYLLFDCRGNG